MWSTANLQQWRQHLVLSLIYFTVILFSQVHCDETADDKVPNDKETKIGYPEVASNRVLPVDAEHKSKISKPLEPYCVENIKSNLKKFLKRYPKRKGRQDDGDDGDGDEGEGIAGLISGIQGGDGPLSTLSQIPAAIPQLVSTLTQLSGAINQGLNGTDTPNIPSFLVRHGMEAIKFFQAIAMASSSGSMANRPPGTVHVQRIPGSGPPPQRPPGVPYEPYPGTIPGGGSIVPGSLGTGVGLPPGADPEDYIDEDVKQPLQPTFPPYGQAGSSQGTSGGYNPFLQNTNLANQQQLESTDPAAAGLPQGTSLWNIYKSFRTRPEGINGTLTDFQLAHPEAFSNELLHSISMAISSVRGQMQSLAESGNKPTSEVLKEVFPANNNTLPPPSIFNSLNRPSLSVYKPKDTISGVGVDLSNLAINASQTILNSVNKPEQLQVANENEDVSSGEATTAAPQGEVESEPIPEGTQRPIKPGATLVSTGTLEKLQQQNQATGKPGGPQFVKSPTSSHLTLQMGNYIPSINNVHEGDEYSKKVGPQQGHSDQMNGFGNKAPYVPVKNGILLEAPRLTPSPLYQKRPSGLVINTDQDRTTAPPAFTTPFPEFHFQVNQNKPDVPPNYHGPDPTTRRPSTLVASIPTKFEYERNRRPGQAQSGVLPPSVFQQVTDAVPESDVNRYTTPVPANEYEEEVVAPTTQPPVPQQQPTRRLTQQQQNAQKLLQQLLLLQSALQQNHQHRLQTNLQILQNAANNVLSQVATTTLAPTPPPELPQLETVPTSVEQAPPTSPPQPVTIPTYMAPKPGGSAIATGFANALANNYAPVGSGSVLIAPSNNLLIKNRPAFANNRPLASFGNPSNGPFAPSAGGAPPSGPFAPSSGGAPPSGPFAPSAGGAPPSSLFAPSSGGAPPSGPFAPSAGGAPPSSLFAPSAGGAPPSGPFAPSAGVAPSSGHFAPISGLVPPSGPFAPSAGLAPPQANPPVAFAPIRTTPVPPTTAKPSTSTAAPVRFQQFPNFAQGPSSYFPQATGPINVAGRPVPSSGSGTWGSPQITPVVGVGAPSLALESLTNPTTDPLKIPVNTPPPIAGAFSPYQPFNSLDQKPTPQQVPPKKPALTLPTTTKPPVTSTTLPPLSSINFASASGGYYPAAGLPVSSNGPVASNVPALPPLPPQPSPGKAPRPPTNDPYAILNNPHFQSPSSSSGGYPQHIPKAPQLVTASGIKSPQTTQPLASTTQPATLKVTSTTTLPTTPPPPSTNPPPKVASAIGQMAQLPYIQEDFFLPSAKPQYITSTALPNPDDSSFEEQYVPQPVTDKAFHELFSAAANVSVTSTIQPPPPPKDIVKLSTVEENDSAEQQPYPNFPPGKPIYWMNMYYPNGVPVLMKVTTTTKPTTPKPRRRKTKSTTTTAASVTEPEYYEEDDIGEGGEKKARRKKKAGGSTTTEADFKLD